VLNSIATNQMTFTLGAAGCVFYRLAYP